MREKLHEKPPVGYQEGGEKMWWWKCARALDDAAIAAVNAMVHNVDGQTKVFALQDKLAEAQKILLEIFEEKKLVRPTKPGAEASK